ncbi:ribonuclease P protein component [Microvirga flavescens]|uniref:ribonuclease P protein component n=1 Tax=Microvirga flavescens TaxID=2249811 RepID=UPI000DD8C3EB|nr:ribonuclease P protein component [Microvirga flavescens]
MRDHRAESVGRLTKRPDFVAAASGRRFHTERMTVQGRPREDIGLGLRVGLTVTKRVGHATERNRIKRRLRAACRVAGAEHAAVNADIVVIGRRDILTADYTLLIEDLQRALRVVTKPKGPQSGDRSRPPSSPPTDAERRGSTNAPGQ